MKDKFGREIDYLRISVTDRCDLRCVYCLPQNADFCGAALGADELAEICGAAAGAGITKVKITGGEPLLRKDIIHIIRQIKQTEGIKSVTLTTNGVLAAKYAKALLEAGINSVNVSLDTLDRSKYQKITGKDCLHAVTEGIKALKGCGIDVRINTVLQYKDDFLPLISFAEKIGVDIRFIELMPIGCGAGFKPLLNTELKSMLGEAYKLSFKGNGPAVYYKGRGIKIGFISPISRTFCDSCNRIRLTSDGYLKSCLCYEDGIYIKDIIYDREKLAAAFAKVIESKPKEHCFSDKSKITEKRGMNKIGG